MTTARCPGTLGERAGVIVGRTRPLIPVNAIPENIIAQAQVEKTLSISKHLIFFIQSNKSLFRWYCKGNQESQLSVSCREQT